MNYRFSNNKTAVYEIIPNSGDDTICRARISNEKNRKKILKNPHKELGAPPPEKTKPGRMNPLGISVFYGSFEGDKRDTCISEIRPPVGAVVIVGKFKIVRPIHILDLTLFNDPDLVWPSMFQPNFNQKIKELKFIKKFHDEISKPILPDDEPLEYIPTQALTEFLANHSKFKLDGIIFASSQTGGTGKNITLFNTTTMLENSITSTVESKSQEGVILRIDPKSLEEVKIVNATYEFVPINNPASEQQNIKWNSQ
jgi:hypothetical protein